MRFFWMRYLAALRKRGAWILLAFLPSLAYLAISTIVPDRFTVDQKIAMRKDTPISVASSPVAYTRMGEVMTRPDEFFANDFTIRALTKHIQSEYPEMFPEDLLRTIKSVVRETLTVTEVTPEVVRIRYRGPDPSLGTVLVPFYSQRLLRQAQDGYARSELMTSRVEAAFAQGTEQGTGDVPAPYLLQGVQLQEVTALWRLERLVPAALLAVFSVLVFLIVLAVFESGDPTLRSERQVARYLGLPIYGSLPDLRAITGRIEGSREALGAS